MPKFLVHQVLPPDGDLYRDHLEPGAEELADQLADPQKPVEVRWLWGCADIERREWQMLFEAPDEERIREFFRDKGYVGIRSITRVMYVDADNLAWALVKGMAERRKTRDALVASADGSSADGDGAGASMQSSEMRRKR